MIPANLGKVNSLAVDSKGRLLLAADYGVCAFTVSGEPPTIQRDLKATWVRHDPLDRFWVGKNNGIKILDDALYTDLTFNERSTFKSDGTLYCMTGSAGLARVSPDGMSRTEILANHAVRDVGIRGDTLVLATAKIPSNPSFVSENELVFANGDGTILDRVALEAEPYKLLVDRDGTAWVWLASNNLVRIKDKTVIGRSSEPGGIGRLVQDSGGFVWGLGWPKSYRYKSDGVLQDTVSSIPNATSESAEADPFGGIVFGLSSGGAIRILADPATYRTLLN